MTQPRYTAFSGVRRLTSGSVAEVALAIRGATGEDPISIFDDATGRPIDIDLNDPSTARFDPEQDQPRGRGRPKLGVTAREVTLLPRHWDWLNAQPGGASVSLRKLVEAARRSPEAAARQRQAAAYAFMSAMGGDFPGFEDATRALFANDRAGLEARLKAWPTDVRDHALALAFAEPAADL